MAIDRPARELRATREMFLQRLRLCAGISAARGGLTQLQQLRFRLRQVAVGLLWIWNDSALFAGVAAAQQLA